eukprot:365971-Chlamydomonas_euryale.AAC.3
MGTGLGAWHGLVQCRRPLPPPPLPPPSLSLTVPRPSFPRALSIDQASLRTLANPPSTHLRMNFPPFFFAYSQLKSAVRAPPTCRFPVGDGAKRTRTCRQVWRCGRSTVARGQYVCVEVASLAQEK